MRSSVTKHYIGFSVRRSLTATEVTIDSIDIAREIFLKRTPRRHRPLVALLRRGLGHRIMLVADGEDWRRTRSAITPHLLPTEVNRRYVPVISSIANTLLIDLSDRAGLGSQPCEIDAEQWMRVVISSIMGQLLFGAPFAIADAEYLETTLDAATKTPVGPLATPINLALYKIFGLFNLQEHQPIIFPRRQKRAADDLIRWLSGEIGRALSSGTQTPILSSLKDRYGHEPPDRRLRLIAAECAMMCIAGIETTAAALTFAITELARSPILRDDVTTEARQNSFDMSGKESVSTQFPCIHRVILETLRRHTIVPTMLREAETDYEMMATTVGENRRTHKVRMRRRSILRYFSVRGHMRTSIWGNPSDFAPDRFLQPLNQEQKKNYLPFGMGPQSCPGQSMAITEAILILQAFFRHFDLEQWAIKKTIPVERNAVFTNRPVGVRVKIFVVRPADRETRAVTVPAP